MFRCTRRALQCTPDSIRNRGMMATRQAFDSRQFSASTRHPQSSDWSSAQYLKFNDERTMPVRDLIAKIPCKDPKLIVDLGCGPGNSTAVLVEQFPSAKIIGMDSSPDMLAKAKKSLPDIEFSQADLMTYQPENSADILFSNAVFQWLPADQRISTMKRLLEPLSSGAVLALQVPDNFDEPSHRTMREVAKSWSDVPGMDSAPRPKFETPETLYNELEPLTSNLNIWHTHYYHVLKDHAAIIEWVKGTGLRPFLEVLNLEQQQDFMKQYLERLRNSYIMINGGRVMLKYPRLFVVAVRA